MGDLHLYHYWLVSCCFSTSCQKCNTRIIWLTTELKGLSSQLLWIAHSQSLWIGTSAGGRNGRFLKWRTCLGSPLRGTAFSTHWLGSGSPSSSTCCRAISPLSIAQTLFRGVSLLLGLFLLFRLIISLPDHTFQTVLARSRGEQRGKPRRMVFSHQLWPLYIPYILRWVPDLDFFSRTHTGTFLGVKFIYALSKWFSTILSF